MAASTSTSSGYSSSTEQKENKEGNDLELIHHTGEINMPEGIFFFAKKLNIHVGHRIIIS